MTNKQVELIKRCLYAKINAECHDDELVEISGKFNGVDSRTAKSLVDAGILIYDMPSYASIYTNSHVRLPRKDDLKDPIRSWDDWLK